MDAYQISFIRMALSVLILGVFMAVSRKGYFRIRRKDIKFFLLFGLAKFISDMLIIITYDYAKASLTAALQMTQIYFVIVLVMVLFHERITRTMAVSALIFTFALVLMSGIINEPGSISVIGVAAGIGSGFCFAVYTLSSKVMYDRDYSPVTSIFYIFLAGSIFSAPLALMSAGKMFAIMADPYNLFLVICMCLLSTLLPFFVQMYCIRWIPVVYISLLGMTVMIGACLTGLIAFGEPITVYEILGMSLMFAAVAYMELKKNRENTDTDG